MNQWWNWAVFLGEPGEADNRKSGLLVDEEVSAIRARLPFGPPSTQVAKDIALKYEISPFTVLNIWTGMSYVRSKACPDGHPLRLALNKRNASKQKIRDVVKPAMRKELGERQEWRCVYCQSDISKKSSIDHIVPIERGGQSEIENLQLVCLRCNQSKRDMSDADYRVKLNGIQKALYKRERFQTIATALLPVVEDILWADSEQAFCYWCGSVTELIDEEDFRSVFRCESCKRIFGVDNSQSQQDFWMEIETIVFERRQYYASPEVVAIVDAVKSGDEIEVMRMVAEWAGNVQLLKRRRHTHKMGSCWCEYGQPSYVPVGEGLAQLAEKQEWSSPIA